MSKPRNLPPGIRERDGRFQVRYYGSDGQRRARSFDRMSDAKRWKRDQEVARDRGEWIDPRRGQTPFGKWAARWMATNAHLKPQTREGYESLLRVHLEPAFGDAALARIEPVDVQEWIAALTARGLSPSRVRQSYFLLQSILRAGVESSYIARTPCIGVKLPKPTRTEMHFLAADEVARLAGVIEEPYGVLVYFLAYGGPRWGEGAALRRSRCDLLRSRVTICESLADVNGHLHFGPTKTYQSRTIALPRFLRDLLAEHLNHHVKDDPDALVFTSPEGEPLRLPNFRRRVWHPALDAAGLSREVRIHDLRHTCAALLIANGAHPKVVQTQLGHSSIMVTMDRYGHLFPDEMDRVADDLDATYRGAETRSNGDEKGTRRGREVIELPIRDAENSG